MAGAPEPAADCQLCPRLAQFRVDNRAAYPAYFNAPVPSFGGTDARLLIVGLAPGLQGANRTGRPFTGDYAGDLLYKTLLDFGFARGVFKADPNDGLTLVDCMITNAVRCVPPQNKPTGEEATTCRRFFTGQMAVLPRLKVLVALGKIAHDAVLSALELRKVAHKFGHGSEHELANGRVLIDSYHCSRYNTNTGVLTEPMFRDVFAKVRARLDAI
jgi:uracil-DNA glycosylase